MKLIKTLVSGQPLTPGQMEDVEGGMMDDQNFALTCTCDSDEGDNTNVGGKCSCSQITPPPGWGINMTAKCVFPKF